MFVLRILYVSLILGICHGYSVPTRQLLDGNRIPIVGYGTWQLMSETLDYGLSTALRYGYRYIDTANAYNNEKDIGKTLKKWFGQGGKREDLFISTKLSPQMLRASDVSKGMNLSLENLELDYIDMYMIHLPVGEERTSDYQRKVYENGSHIFDFSTDLVAVWKEMEELVRAGKAKSIGLANFNKSQIMRIWDSAEIKPTYLQVESNPYINEEELLELCNELGIVMTGYSPLGSRDLVHMRKKRETALVPQLLDNPVLRRIGRKYRKSPAQVALRFDIQRNIVVIPKSSNPSHIYENIHVFDFNLSRWDMNKLKALDQNGRYKKYDFLTLTGIEKHPEYPFTYRLQ